METTDQLDLNITTESSFSDDDIKQTIVSYGDNFKKIEQYMKNSTNSIEDLSDNKLYKVGHILWNKTPVITSFVGWVVTREGIQAKNWLPNKNYSIGNLVKPPVDNGGLYECVVDGKSSTTPPTFLTVLDQEFYEVTGSTWRNEFNYEVGNLVFPTNGNKTHYYICETAGYSSPTEPEWASIKNDTAFVDGSVVWRKAKNIIWKRVGTNCEFRPFGKIE
ncbi:hypothetical protein FJQ98_16810 [Lysinibacillus agricola]|uniref:Ig-like domain-containing protein n=1 Tax=Lysinibacillus agricola TaxID=2590012 RepID=A0ABX7ALX4_9BACI|nr:MULTISPECIES: hypothetical protein [Lysinibacillus]KOS61416.1 hypothetical protein AN161_17620 [Lysinibacillus sp. FJAT-14222]QQP10905.1 hypothetical protein FJQ98_16810 [Lysinibacillus agricola]